MRKFIPLAVIGCGCGTILGLIVGGVVLVGYGLSAIVSHSGPKPEASQTEPQSALTLLDKRRNFKTSILPSNFESKGELPPAPPGWKIVSYKSRQGDLGELSAYISLLPPNKARHAGGRLPGVVFVADGFGGIDTQTLAQAEVFRKAGCVVMCPSFRGENKNPGKFEMFYGEVEDLLGAVDYLARQPGADQSSVNSQRIYVVGVGTGGTLSLLAAANGPNSTARAFFAVGGCPDLAKCLDSKGKTTPPFDPKNPQEIELRSASNFIRSIQRQTFYIGSQAELLPGNPVLTMERDVQQIRGVPFHVKRSELEQPALVKPALEAIAHAIMEDKGNAATINLNEADLSEK